MAKAPLAVALWVGVLIPAGVMAAPPTADPTSNIDPASPFLHARYGASIDQASSVLMTISEVPPTAWPRRWCSRWASTD